MKRAIVAFLALLVLPPGIPAQGQAKKLPRIVILATGGTIAGSADSKTSVGYTSGAVTVDGITVKEKTLARYMETTVGIVTALNPVLGYEKSTELAAEAYTSGKGIMEIIREKKLLTDAQIKELLDPIKLTGLDRSKYMKK